MFQDDEPRITVRSDVSTWITPFQLSARMGRTSKVPKPMSGLETFFPGMSEVLRGAGNIVRRYFGGDAGVRYKKDGSPVTQADLEVEAFLRDSLSKLYPDSSVLGEEYGETRKSGSLRWIIDPIDGTRSFLMGTPLFGTLLALERDDVPVVGAIYLPILDQLMIGSAETGTFVNGQKCHVSKIAELSQARLVLTDPTNLLRGQGSEAMARLARRAGLVRGFGDCYGYFLVACGLADVMVDQQVQYYDVAPMLPILAGAGGAFSALNGRVDWNAGNAMASNGLLHDQARKLLSSEPA